MNYIPILCVSNKAFWIKVSPSLLTAQNVAAIYHSNENLFTIRLPDY
jgi:hypothetical protein